ncbi:MAG: biopolymer transporter ExbD [Bdellovibrionota bacterium]
MGAQIPGTGSNPLRSSAGSLGTLSEINVTPLVDVMLVLLIVFMISAPLMQQGVQVDLPKADTGSLSQTHDQLVIVLHRGKEITLNGNRIEEGTLRRRLEAIAAVKPETEVFIQADQNLTYGYIAKVMADVKKAKIFRVGLVTDPEGRP